MAKKVVNLGDKDGLKELFKDFGAKDGKKSGDSKRKPGTKGVGKVVELPPNT